MNTDDMAEVVPFIIVGYQTINSICSVDYHVGFNMIPPYCAVYMYSMFVMTRNRLSTLQAMIKFILSVQYTHQTNQAVYYV